MMGKSGTLTVEDFASLKALAAEYGAAILARKVAKACSNKAKLLMHEYPSSAVGKAYSDTAAKVIVALGATGNGSVKGSTFTTIGQLVGRYGAELIVQKLAKIAKKTDMGTSRTLSAIFPVAKAA
jgi:hypothetical protein